MLAAKHSMGGVMIRIALRAALLIGSVAAAPAASAQEDPNSGNFWLRHCQGQTPTPLCAGYLNGFIDMNWVLSASNDNPLWCPPETATLEQMRKVVLARLDSRPQNLHQPFAMLVAGALMSAFPCAAREPK